MHGISVHPSKRIIGSVNEYLKGRCIALGLTGSVSAYRSIDVARWLMRRGARVIPIMTKPATNLVTPTLLHWATSEKPIVELSGEVEHVTLAESCDAVLVAPATLSTMAKIASGITDNPVALTAVSASGESKPVVIVPAMHQNMMESKAYQRIVSELQSEGFIVIPPKVEEGIAKYPDPWIVARIVAAIASRGRDLQGKRILVTAGATREWIDPTRFISNPSSGRMGIEIAVEAWARGAMVDLVYGAITHPLPHVVNSYEAPTTEDMAEIVAKLSSEKYDIAVAAASPADYKPEKTENMKIKSGINNLNIKLIPTPKVIEIMSKSTDSLIAFAAETAESPEELERAAIEKLEKYRAKIVVANNVGRKDVGFSSPFLEALLLWRDRGGIRKNYLGKIDKEILARLIIDLALKEACQSG